MTEPIYDRIGVRYRDLRQPDPRIAAAIWRALGDARSVVNVGAGAGSYEPTDRAVIAVEPSQVMIDQRPAGSAEVIQGCAEALPLADDSVDAALAILTVHHWSDPLAGVAEMQRVARRRVVIVTFDPDAVDFWLYDYFPQIPAVDRVICPSIAELGEALGRMEVATLPVPHDCVDGFLGAYWRRPERYLDPAVRAAISSFGKITEEADGVALLRADLESGAWRERYGALYKRASVDLGYRILTSRAPGPAHRSGTEVAASA